MSEATVTTPQEAAKRYNESPHELLAEIAESLEILAAGGEHFSESDRELFADLASRARLTAALDPRITTPIEGRP